MIFTDPRFITFVVGGIVWAGAVIGAELDPVSVTAVVGPIVTGIVGWLTRAPGQK